MFAVDQAAIVYSEVSYDNAICHADPTVTSFPNVLYLQRSCLKLRISSKKPDLL